MAAKLPQGNCQRSLIEQSPTPVGLAAQLGARGFDWPCAQGSGHEVAAWIRCGDGGSRSSSNTGRIGRGHKLPPQLGHIPIKWPSTQRRQKVHSYVQIIASVDAGGRSTSQHSQLGRNSSTP
jgi:hypothetical protein